MFTVINFIKLFLALLLAGGSTYFPIIGDLGNLVGGGATGSIVGFVIATAFYLFLISKVLDFFAFAFGGGVGRYNTTKLYRRLQWLTFALLMTLPCWVAATLIFSATPWAEHSETYHSQVALEHDRRRAVALQRQRQQVSDAQTKRRSDIEAERKKQQEAYEKALSSRRKRIESKRKALKEEVEKIIAQRADMKALEKQSSALSKQTSPLINKYLSLNYDQKGYEREATSFVDWIQKKYRIDFTDDERNEFTKSAAAAGIMLTEVQLNPNCQRHFKAKSFQTSEVLKIQDGRKCFLAFIVYNFRGNKPTDSRGSVILTPILDDFSKDYRKFVPLVSRSRILDDRKSKIKEKFRAEFERAQSYTVPEISRSRYLPVNEAKFPILTAANFPLSIEQGPVVADDPYFEKISPTFQKHFWWLFLIALWFWLIVQSEGKVGISRFYGRFRRFLDEGRLGFGGAARFTSMFEEWGKPYRKGALYMGRSLYNPFDEIGLGGEAHMLTVAGSRGGKGTTAIIPNLLLWEGSAVVIDPKGTNAHVTANARRKMGQDVHIIDPFGIVTKDSARFDPLEHITPDDPLMRERIASIADALVIPDDNTKDKHWDDGARTIISGIIAQVIAQNPNGKRLFEIRDLINQKPETQDELWADMAVDEEHSGYAKDAAIRYMRGSNTSEILGILSNADKHTEWLSSPVMRSITSNPTFSIKDIKKKPTTIYLVIPPRQLERQNRLLRLFINLVIDAMEDGGRSKIPVLMIMDEFLALGKMPEISTAFATMASYNLTLWPFVQEMEKLKSMYGGSFNSFIANSRAVQVFATSDQKTKEYVSERLGNRPLSGLSNISKSNDTLPLRAPSDVETDLAASERRQYIIEAGKPAMLLEKVPYYRSNPISWLGLITGRFKGKYDPDPDFSG